MKSPRSPRQWLPVAGVAVLFLVMALFLRPAAKDSAEDVCKDIAARALAAATPGPRSALDFTPPNEDEMNALVTCLEQRRNDGR